MSSQKYKLKICGIAFWPPVFVNNLATFIKRILIVF